VCVSQVVGIEITDNKSVRRVREKFRGESARSKIRLSVSEGKRVNTEEEKRGSLLKVDFDTEIV